jgi:hypothetical protein
MAKRTLEKIGTAAAVRHAMAAVHRMIADRECVKCYGPADVDGSIACSTCIRERDEWNRREQEMLAALSNGGER